MPTKTKSISRGITSTNGSNGASAKGMMERPASLAGTVLQIPLANVLPSLLNPRKNFAEEDLAELAGSIRTHGILEPILVRVKPGESRMLFEIIAGERRWRAAERAGLTTVPCIVREVESDREALELALIENLIRRDIDPIEAAEGYQALRSMGHSVTEIAGRIHRSQELVSNALRLLNLPEVTQEAVRTGTLTASHGRALARFAGFPDLAAKLTEMAISQKTPVKDLEKGLPFTYHMLEANLARQLDSWQTKFSWDPSCRECPFGAFLDGGSWRYCLKPVHYEELNMAAIAAKEAEVKQKAEELVAATVADRPGVEASEVEVKRDRVGTTLVADDLIRSSAVLDLSERWNQGISACTPDCVCRGRAVNREGEIVDVCTDPPRHAKMKAAQEKQEKAARRQIGETQILKALHGIEAPGSSMAGRARALLAAEVLKGNVGKGLPKAAKAHGVTIRAFDLGYQGIIENVYQELSNLSERKLIAFLLEARLRQELEEYLEYSGRQITLIDYVLGGAKGKEKPIVESQVQDDEEESDAMISVYKADITPDGLPPGTMTANVRFCNDRPACVEGAPKVAWAQKRSQNKATNATADGDSPPDA
jgi:ParB/RepB/Spo0J family partition protein